MLASGGGSALKARRLNADYPLEPSPPQTELQQSPIEELDVMEIVQNPQNPFTELYSQFQTMPAKKSKKGGKRKSTSGYRRYGGRKLSPAAAHLARLADIKIKRAKFDQELSAITDIPAGGVAPLSQFPDQTRAARDLLDTKMSLSTGRVHGRGRYTFGSFMRNLESTGRRFLRSGGGLDTVLGAATRAKTAVEGMGRYGGMGEYHDNQLIQGGALSSDVYGNTDETDTIVLSDEEFVQNVYAPQITHGTSSGFAAVSIPFNPGLQNLTRKLAQYSKHYQEYEIGQLVFRLEPMVEKSDVNNGITGSFSMAWQYDPNEEEPDNEDDMNALYGVCIGHKLSDGLRLGVECDPAKSNKTSYRIRSHPVPFGRDVDEYDHGKLVIASNNIPSTFSNLAIAKLHVYYTLQLRKFKPDRTVLRDIFSVSKNATASAFTTTPSTQFSENTVVYAQQNNLGCRIASGGAGTMIVTFPPTFSGAVSVCLRFEGTGLIASAAAFTKTGNLQFISDFIASSTAGDTPTSNSVVVSSTTVQLETRCRIQSATGNTENALTIGVTPSAGTVNQWVIDIQEYSPQFFQSRGNATPIVLNLTNNRVEELS